MVKISTSEHCLNGVWRPTDGRLVADEMCERIDALVRTHLNELARDASGWGVLYIDPDDGRLWELTYPNSAWQGGGPPELRVLNIDEARRKFRVSITLAELELACHFELAFYGEDDEEC